MTTLSEIRSRLDELNENRKDLESVIFNVKFELGELESDLRGLTTSGTDFNRHCLEEDIKSCKENISSLNKELTALKEDYDDQQLLISRIVDSGIRLPDIGVTTAPPIDGMVVGVQEGVVVLSVGKDDNVEIGYEFTIYDGNRFIGKVQVTKVLDDMSGCTILFQEDSGIREGHKASTRLSS